MITQHIWKLTALFPAGRWLSEQVARIRAPISTKLLVAFLGITVLLIALGTVGLATLRAANNRTAQLLIDQEQFTVYRDVNNQLNETILTIFSLLDSEIVYGIRSAASIQNDNGWFLTHVNVAKRAENRRGNPDEAYIAALEKFSEDWDRLFKQALESLRLAKADNLSAAKAVFSNDFIPLAGRIQRTAITNSLSLEKKMARDAAFNDREFQFNQRTVITTSVAAVALALLLGYTISTSIIRPVDSVRWALRKVASGDFATRVNVANRDELGDLSDSVNRMTSRLSALYGELQAANQHKSQFLANMSHEFRTPMNSILGYTELIQDGIYGDPPTKIAEVLARIEANGKNLLNLINDVLDISKIEAGQIELQIEEYKMADIIQSVQSTVEPLAAEKGLALEIDIDPSMPTGLGDASRLRQVVLNVVGNAVKFTKTGKVSIAASAVGALFKVKISDTGPGISDADQKTIFEEFQQADTSSIREVGGTGLGLAISKRFVEMHGGRIWVESILGEGTCFVIELPIQTDTATATIGQHKESTA